MLFIIYLNIFKNFIYNLHNVAYVLINLTKTKTKTKLKQKNKTTTTTTTIYILNLLLNL